MNTGLVGRVAAVTLAGSGIGAATTRALVEEGCRFVAADLRAESTQGLVDEFGDDAVVVRADVSLEHEAKAVVEAARSTFGGLDVLVCCAGVYETNVVATIDQEGWDRVLAVNLRVTFLCSQAAIPVMAATGWGRIITVSSIAALTGGMAAGPAYVASKAGIMGLTRSLAHSAGPLGITVNCVNPGTIETPMTAVLDFEVRRALAERTPLRRNGQPADVAAVIVFLASEGAGFIHGAHLSINGGLFMD